MKLLKLAIAPTLAAFILSSAAIAQDTTTKDRNPGYPDKHGMKDVSELKGLSVVNAQNEELGEIHRLLADTESGNIRYAVIQVDKAWTWNEPEVLIPFQSLTMEQRADGRDARVVIDADKAKLERAPRYREADVSNLSTRDGGKEVYSYWDKTWSDSSTQGEATRDRDKDKTPRSDASPAVSERGADATRGTSDGADATRATSDSEPGDAGLARGRGDSQSGN